ncbi:MAG: aldo/keto reductase [Aigarchaeota archaeon]|nr:aldo/keto reductase [Aigarchaeota archaeon]MDW8092295.1 aldo/keto reductase [Nitrososphaerota archaeon]
MSIIKKRLGSTDEYIPEIGLGTWEIGGRSIPDYSHDLDAINAIKYAVELGMTHIDTAEMYAAGHAEELVGEALRQYPRDQVFVASKVWPTNLRYDDVIRSCDATLRRLGMKYVDLYMIHWPNREVPLRDTMKALEKLYRDGKIRHIGVSNFSIDEVEQARSYLSVTEVVANQVEYSLLSRWAENGLLQHCSRERITVTAYSPLGKGRLLAQLNNKRSELYKVVSRLAERYQRTPVQILLNWVVHDENVITIPKAIKRPHLEENAGASGWRLSDEDYRSLSNASLNL